ncbi:helix-turn-helix domain-containing protein [Arsenicibacter rosenii]|uniref:HTH cro/C1-type domain-containing protein n=1 Tax=Arsenicibacter rosenii TaxID=1750698 RepID=A0A1S2VIR2_9BACT|nr:helix-turn-helix transcriptional regulator [Arsenicibacter rosenii]OIN58106.1 hypothetical protein BLX24_16400 [Arsenicibacter rosenii]
MNPATTRQLSRNIRQYREDRKISQEAIAFLIGVSQSTLSRLETGQHLITTSLLHQLARAFKTTPAILQTYHLTKSDPAETNNASLLAQKDLIITAQQAEIVFLRQKLSDLQQLLASSLQGSN